EECRRGVQVPCNAHAIGEETNTYQLLWLVIGQIPEQDVVHDSADPDGGTDPDSECGDNAGRKSGRPPKTPNGKACVSGEIVERDDARRVASLLPEPLRATKTQESGASCL